MTDERDESGFFWVRYGKYWTIGEHDITLMPNKMQFAVIGHGNIVVVDEVGPRIDQPECVFLYTTM